MNNQDLKSLINKAHENAVKHGFYDNLEKCKETYEKLLMLIISEISEFMEADRKGRWSSSGKLFDTDELNHMTNGAVRYYDFEKYYKDYVKGSAEEELADICIRCFDMLGYIEADETDINKYSFFAEHCTELSVPSLCYSMCGLLMCTYEERDIADSLMQVVKATINWCSAHNVNLMLHIHAKMLFNMNRPRKHGKEY